MIFYLNLLIKELNMITSFCLYFELLIQKTLFELVNILGSSVFYTHPFILKYKKYLIHTKKSLIINSIIVISS